MYSIIALNRTLRQCNGYFRNWPMAEATVSARHGHLPNPASRKPPLSMPIRRTGALPPRMSRRHDFHRLAFDDARCRHFQAKQPRTSGAGRSAAPSSPVTTPFRRHWQRSERRFGTPRLPSRRRAVRLTLPRRFVYPLWCYPAGLRVARYRAGASLWRDRNPCRRAVTRLDRCLIVAAKILAGVTPSCNRTRIGAIKRLR